MHKFLLLFSLIPFITNTQVKPLPANKAPLLISIVSDTVNRGNYKAVFFEYDALKRVSAISWMIYETKHLPNGLASFEKTMQHQYFQYHDKEQLPYGRRIETNKFDDETGKWLWSDVEDHIFQFEKGQLVGDSIFIYPRRTENVTLDRSNAKRVRAIVKQTPSKLVRIIDLSKKEDPNRYVAPNIHRDSMAITKDLLIGYESSENDWGEKWEPRAYFKFTKYDQAINPLHQLNIAPILSNDKISISYNDDDLLLLDPKFDHNGGTELIWHFFNLHNPLLYSIERGETETPFKDIIQFSYSYNQYQQPTYCKATIKKVIKNDPEHNYGTIGTFKKSFTFRYKKGLN